MGALSFPYNYLCTVFGHAIHVVCFQLSSFVAHRGGQHTFKHTWLRFISVPMQYHSFCGMMPKHEGRFHTSVTTRTTAARCPRHELYWLDLSHSQLCFAWAFAWSQRDSLRLRSQRQSLRALYSLYRFVHVAQTPFFDAKAVFSWEWGQLQRGKWLSTDTVLQEKKIFCCC